MVHFIEQHRDRPIGKRICRYHSNEVFDGHPDEPGHMEILSADARRLPSEIPPKE